MLSIDVVVSEAYQTGLGGMVTVRSQPSTIQVHDDGQYDRTLKYEHENATKRDVERDIT